MKKVYEKPAMLVEEFVATQSVAASCGMDFSHDPIDLTSETKSVCKCENHSFDIDLVTIEGKKISGTVAHDYDANDDGIVTLFNTSNCELKYDTFSNIVDLGRQLTSSNAWSSHEHAMIIDGVQIPS